MNLKLKEELKNAVSKYNQRQYRKKYYKTHKKKENQTSKLYRKNNKEQTLENNREWRKANPHYQTKYNNTPNGYKVYTKSNWKSRGLVMDNFEEIFDRYMKTTNCDRCNIELTTRDNPPKMTTKCMDHQHQTGLFRNILCTKCNWIIVK